MIFHIYCVYYALVDIHNTCFIEPASQCILPGSVARGIFVFHISDRWESQTIRWWRDWFRPTSWLVSQHISHFYPFLKVEVSTSTVLPSKAMSEVISYYKQWWLWWELMDMGFLSNLTHPFVSNKWSSLAPVCILRLVPCFITFWIKKKNLLSFHIL